MATVIESSSPSEQHAPDALVGEAPPSPAGPIEPTEAARLPEPPMVPLPRWSQVLRFNQRQIEFVFRAGASWARSSGCAARSPGTRRSQAIPTTCGRSSRPSPSSRPSLTGESPLRPIVGPNSTLTALGARHMRQRKLLLPSFHGDAVERYAQMIADVTEREIDSWPVGRAVRARAADAGDHPRRDHVGGLRDRRTAALRQPRVRRAHGDEGAARGVDVAAGAGRRADEHRP